ncbi:MAG: helix-turn-helix transcriptional regulator [Synechococcaceae cyanobacterium SM2_3_2]|nr:helix-turn-helix transcriptional regulator [Synechococcaceae cyanobacterium SM2_3_2]
MLLSQADYWELVQGTEVLQTDLDGQDCTWKYPPELGQGSYREVMLREGLELSVSRYQLHQPLHTQSFDREHPIELSFYLSGQHYMENDELCCPGDFTFCGSGLAPGGKVKFFPDYLMTEFSLHIAPELFCQWMGNNLPVSLETLIRDPHELFYYQHQVISTTMSPILTQILDCPYHGAVKRMYLESKVWELVAIHLGQMLKPAVGLEKLSRMKQEDLERIRYAKEILMKNIQDPPSLAELAKLSGINDNKLKVGFREMFGTTVFGYLHQQRMELARQLLISKSMTVGSVAHAVGFASFSNFTKAFRTRFGMTPSQYRKR